MKFYDRIILELKAENKSFENIYSKISGFSEKVIFESSKSMSVKTTTYAQFTASVSGTAKAISERFFPAESGIVGLRLENCEEWFVAFWALLMAGYTPLLLNVAADEEVCASLMREAGAIALIDRGGDNGIDGLLRSEASDFAPRFADEIIFATSGTTGRPRLYAYSGAAITSQLLNAGYIMKKNPAMREQYKKGERVLTLLPFCHIFGLVTNLLWFTLFGQTLVLLKNTAPATILNTCRLHGVTHIFAPPVLWNTVLSGIMTEAKNSGQLEKLEKGLKISLFLQNVMPYPGRKLAGKLFSDVQKSLFGRDVHFCISGGGMIKPEALRVINGIGYLLAVGYGMTEIGITSVELRRAVKHRLTGSIGRPFPSVEFEVRGDGGEGTLFVRGASCHDAYYKEGVRYVRDPMEWFDTGDLCRYDNGDYYFVGRNDDIFSGANGERISPDELERAFDPPYINSMCIYGDTSDGRSDAVLVLEPADVDRADLIIKTIKNVTEHIDAMGAAQRITKILVAQKPLPVSLNAKVNRKAVRTGVANGSLPCLPAGSYMSVDPDKARDGALTELSARVCGCFAKALGRDVSDINADSQFVYDLSGGSMEYFTLLELVESELGTPVKPAAGEVFTTPRQFAEYILHTTEQRL